METKELATISEIKDMASAVCKSNLFAMPSPEAAFALMLLCQSEGLHPIQAMKRYHIIKGRPSMRADAMLAEFQRQGGRVEWLERTDKACRATFSHEQGGKITVEWSIEMAKNAGLLNNPTWSKYPRQMLTARVISEGVRTVLPGVVVGIYTPEEINDFTEIKAEVIPDKPKKEKKQSKPADEIKKEPADTEPVDVEIIEPAAPIEQEQAKEPEKSEPFSAKVVADELAKIRKLAIAAGCASREEIQKLICDTVGRSMESATSLTADERINVINALEAM